MSEEPRPAYPPAPFRETRRETILAFMRAVRFGHLISTGPQGRLHATGVPFLVRETAGEVALEAHLQRGNPQWRALEGEVLALFQGPNAYVHPGWYQTKRADGRVVPTWNYMAVQARGSAQAFEGDRDWLAGHLAALTRAQEEGRPEPWSMADAPSDYLETLLGGIVGVRLTVTELDGRWKLSQNHPQANRAGVIAGLMTSGQAAGVAVAEAMASNEALRGT